MRTPSKIKVNVLDLTEKEKEAFDHMQNVDPREDLESVKVSQTWGYVETPNGIYLICKEGVGEREQVSDEYPARFQFSREFRRDGEQRSFELSPCVGISMNDEDLLCLPVKEVTTLDKFIRVYNSRLESNYEQWQDYLSREMERPKTCSTRERVEDKKDEEVFKKSELAELLS